MTSEPDAFVADVRHGLTIAGVFYGMKTRLLSHRHVAKDLAVLRSNFTIQPAEPAWLIERLYSRS